MIVILEGPDGAGKTTLAESLTHTFGLSYRHEGPPPADATALVHYTGLLFDAALENMCGPGVVFDRFALGELVYGPIYRGASKFNADSWRRMREEIRFSKAIEITCLPPIETCRASWASGRDEMFPDDEARFRATWTEFDLLSRANGIRKYDWTQESVWQILDWINERRA